MGFLLYYLLRKHEDPNVKPDAVFNEWAYGIIIFGAVIFIATLVFE